MKTSRLHILILLWINFLSNVALSAPEPQNIHNGLREMSRETFLEDARILMILLQHNSQTGRLQLDDEAIGLLARLQKASDYVLSFGSLLQDDLGDQRIVKNSFNPVVAEYFNRFVTGPEKSALDKLSKMHDDIFDHDFNAQAEVTQGEYQARVNMTRANLISMAKKLFVENNLKTPNAQLNVALEELQKAFLSYHVLLGMNPDLVEASRKLVIAATRADKYVPRTAFAKSENVVVDFGMKRIDALKALAFSVVVISANVTVLVTPELQHPILATALVAGLLYGAYRYLATPIFRTESLRQVEEVRMYASALFLREQLALAKGMFQARQELQVMLSAELKGEKFKMSDDPLTNAMKFLVFGSAADINAVCGDRGLMGQLKLVYFRNW